MVHTILVPLDGSDLGEHALPLADRLAAVLSARLVLSCSVPDSVLLESADEKIVSERQVRAYLNDLAQRLSARGREVVIRIPHASRAARGILEEADSVHASLVIMATQGRSGFGRWLFGSVGDRVLRDAGVPIILVPPGAADAWPSMRRPSLLVPLDGSPLAEAALLPATALAAASGASLTLLQVVADLAGSARQATTYLEDVARRRGLPTARLLAETGQPGRAIADTAHRESADLIVMATHGRTGLARVLVGSVATDTLQRASVPLMLVSPPGLRTLPRSAVAARVLS